MKKTLSAALAVLVSLVAAGLASPGHAVQKSPGYLEISKSNGTWGVIHKGLEAKDRVSSLTDSEEGVGVIQSPSRAYVLQHAGFAETGFPVAALVSSETLELAWARDEPNSYVSLSVNGVEISSGVDEDLSAPVLAVQPNSRFNIHISRTSKLRKPVKGATSDLLKTDFTEFQITTPDTSTLSAAYQAITLSSITPASRSVFRQMTFIPTADIAAPLGACAPGINYRFRGDNRSWSSNYTASHRTRMDVVIDWVAGTAPTVTKSVGTTIREVQDTSGAWVEDARKTASTSTMSIKNVARTSSVAHFILSQDVVNPLCSSILTNGIYSKTDVYYYRSGSINGTIEYIAMPNYEIYSRQDQDAYQKVAQLALESPLCLVKLLGTLGCSRSEEL